MALAGVGRLWSLARKVEDLFKLQTEMRESLTLINDHLRSLEDRMVKLEAEQPQVISEAKSASTAAATMIASSVISDAVTRITRLEERVEQVNKPRLSRSKPKE